MRAGGVVADHAAERADHRRGRVGAKLHAIGGQAVVERLERDARLHQRAAALGVHRQQVVHILGHIDHDRRAHGLAGQAAAAAARQHRQAIARAERHRRGHVVAVARRDHRQRHDLVAGGVGREQRARHGVGVDIAMDLRPAGVDELVDERAALCCGHVGSPVDSRQNEDERATR